METGKASEKPKVELDIDRDALKSLKLVAVAYSSVEREFFPTEEAYQAELEVEERAAQVVEEVEKLGVHAQGYPADRYFLPKLMVDQPDLVINLVDTLRGRERLQASIPGALELAEIPYTGAGLRGMVIGNDRNLFKQLLDTHDIPTPDYQFISRTNTKILPELGLPLIVKLNESGGSVGIDNAAVKETIEKAQKKVKEMISTYHIPVVVERFIDGPEITVVVFEDKHRKHVFMAQKQFNIKPDGRHEFTSKESYEHKNAYVYHPIENEELGLKIEDCVKKAFVSLHNRDYAKFDVRVDEETGTPYFTDCNPNTAFGPDLGLPFTEILDMFGVPFTDVLASLISKYARQIEKAKD